MGNKLYDKAQEAAQKTKELAEKAREFERKNKRSDIELGGPNPALLNDSNSLPADAQGLGGAMDEEGARKMSSDLVNRYKGYLLKNMMEYQLNGLSMVRVSKLLRKMEVNLPSLLKLNFIEKLVID